MRRSDTGAYVKVGRNSNKCFPPYKKSVGGERKLRTIATEQVSLRFLTGVTEKKEREGGREGGRGRESIDTCTFRRGGSGFSRVGREGQHTAAQEGIKVSYVHTYQHANVIDSYKYLHMHESGLQVRWAVM